MLTSIGSLGNAHYGQGTLAFYMYVTGYGHVKTKRRDKGHILRRMLDAPIPRKRWRGRQKTRWKDLCKTKRHGKCGFEGG